MSKMVNQECIVNRKECKFLRKNFLDINPYSCYLFKLGGSGLWNMPLLSFKKNEKIVVKRCHDCIKCGGFYISAPKELNKFPEKFLNDPADNNTLAKYLDERFKIAYGEYRRKLFERWKIREGV